MSKIFRLAFSFLLALAVGCVSNGSGRGGGGGCSGEVPQSIVVQPADATIAVDNGAANPVAYTAVAKYADGHTETLADSPSSDGRPPLRA